MKQFVLIIIFSCSSLLYAPTEWDRLFDTFKEATQESPYDATGEQLEQHHSRTMQKVIAYYYYLKRIGVQICWHELIDEIFHPQAKL